MRDGAGPWLAVEVEAAARASKMDAVLQPSMLARPALRGILLDPFGRLSKAPVGCGTRSGAARKHKLPIKLRPRDVDMQRPSCLAYLALSRRVPVLIPDNPAAMELLQLLQPLVELGLVRRPMPVNVVH